MDLPALNTMPINNPLPGEAMLERLSKQSEPGNKFAQLLQNSNPSTQQTNPPLTAKGATMEQAAHQMEVMLTTFMLKAMDKSGTEGGLLGNASQGMGYFKDQFFQEIAESVVGQRGLGFAQSLNNMYKPNKLDP